MRKPSQLLYLFLVIGILTIFGYGCIGFGNKPYVAVKYYDLDNPPQIALEGMQVKFLPLESTGPSKYKMVYRNTGCEMIIDDYNKWVQPPCMLLTRYIESAFKQTGMSSGKSELIISGNVFMFRIDLKTNTASLGVNYVIRGSSDDVIESTSRNSTIFTCKFNKQGPEHFVKAMSNCAKQLVIAISNDIKKIQKDKPVEKKLISKK